MQKMTILDGTEGRAPEIAQAAPSLFVGKVFSKDGTAITFDRIGNGPPVILVDGALCYRGMGQSGQLAKLLAPYFTVFTYDRRGRGESGDTALSYAVEREVEDIAAILNEAGGAAFLWGMSSGAVLALEAAIRLRGIKKLALYEAPFIVDDSREVEKYKTRRLDEGAAPATVNRELALLRRVLRRAKQNGELQNELPYIRMLPENNKRMNFINDAVFDRMASEAAKEGLWLRALLEVAWKYGWRRGEMVGLRVQDVDLDRRSLRLETSKNGEPREVWMDNEVLALIAPLCHGKEPNSALFTRPDGAPVRDFRAAWQNMCIRAGAPAPDKKPSRFECSECEKPIEAGVAKCKCGGSRRYIGLLVHDMRRSAARSLLNAGVSQIDVQNTTGHKTESMLRRYAIFNLEASRRAMQRRVEAINPSITPPQEDAPRKETTIQ